MPKPTGDLNTIHRPKNRETRAYAYPEKYSHLTAKHFLASAPTFQADVTLSTLSSRPKNQAKEKIRLEAVIESMRGLDAQVFSGRWVDRNGEPLAAYFAHRAEGDGSPVG